MYLKSVIFAIFLSTSVIANLNISDEEILGIRLKSASTEVNRLNLLTDSQFVFDFNQFKTGNDNATGVTVGKAGRTVAAVPNNFPALIGHGVAMTVGFIEPCGINLPHTHPRATEINFIVSGTFRAGFFLENGARFIGHNLTAGMMTIFPQGSIHFEQNEGCEPAMFVAAFNNEDPGVQTTTLSYFGLPADIAATGFDGANATLVQELALKLQKNPALGVEECRIRCGLSTGDDSSSTGSSSNGSSSTCSAEGNMRCASSDTYQTCAQNDQGQLEFGVVQQCQTGLSCHASGDNIYCY